MTTTHIIEAVEHSLSLRYPGQIITRLETHISWVLLMDQWAIKFKKPLSNPFLDYSTLELRKQFCLSECLLNRRFAPELYLGVVAIIAAAEGGEGVSDPTMKVDIVALDELSCNENCPYEQCSSPTLADKAMEYGVLMHRFPQDALLAERLAEELVLPAHISRLAQQIAQFHAIADVASNDTEWGSEELVSEDQYDNFVALRGAVTTTENVANLQAIEKWVGAQIAEGMPSVLTRRRSEGRIRACHGDLHAENLVWYRDAFIPFDGIEFSDRLRWIDVQSDLAFLAMDLLHRGHPEFSALLINAYLEQTGDYDGLHVLRWYQVYRAMVRAKVAKMQELDETHIAEYLAVAMDLIAQKTPTLFITFGVSGSGKTTGTQRLVEEGAIRLRSDVERKRLVQQGEVTDQSELYGSAATEATYVRLSHLAQTGLSVGYSIVVDATFLRRAHREQFRQLANSMNIPFRILIFDQPREVLVNRLRERKRLGTDASDADESTLQWQYGNLEMLTNEELRFAWVGS